MNPNAFTRAELAHEALRHAQRQPLDAMFEPRSVAVIGASEKTGSVGQALVQNLRFFGGPVFLVNAKRKKISGLDAYPEIAAVPENVDLAVIATPAPTVPGILRECGLRECLRPSLSPRAFGNAAKQELNWSSNVSLRRGARRFGCSGRIVWA